ncbi:hypothetical protein AOB46_18905 [Chryseobacterium indologenes]|uniref:Uncharacterized protein n=1 Tax=Chryseobacterium indologenes TaxID=253 RepID=A0A0N0IUH2_CHRID|nr:hypothetical protein AOB46_18905 [Chryseobacterium indologenes]
MVLNLIMFKFRNISPTRLAFRFRFVWMVSELHIKCKLFKIKLIHEKVQALSHSDLKVFFLTAIMHHYRQNIYSHFQHRQFIYEVVK